MPRLDVHCPGCGTVRALDIRTIDRPPLASSILEGVTAQGVAGSLADKSLARAAASGDRKVRDAREVMVIRTSPAGVLVDCTPLLRGSYTCLDNCCGARCLPPRSA